MTDTDTATWTPEACVRLRAYLDRPGYVIPAGLGTEEAACSVAADAASATYAAEARPAAWAAFNPAGLLARLVEPR